MARGSRFVTATFVVASSLAGSLVPRLAGAQTITPLNNGLPYRLDANGNDVTSLQRPKNLHPTGISFNDCIANMTLGFPVALSGFTGQSLQIWVGTEDCTSDAARGQGGTPPVCWRVADLASLNVLTGSSTQFNVRMQDIVGPQNAPPSTGSLVHETSTACYSQQ